MWNGIAEPMKGARKMNEKSCPTSDIGRAWQSIDFHAAKAHVNRLQNRITKALLKGDFVKAESLIHVLTHSFYAKALAVKVVISNKGKQSPGIDNDVWISPAEKYAAALDLKARGYHANALLRKYIPKANGDLRPLSIPTMKDRAMQTLYSFALEPYAEITADEHSYGYRRNCRAQDAICRCLDVLNAEPYPRWILEGDIKACFDHISHEWLLKNVPMDKRILKEFLKISYVENGRLYSVDEGTPQGGSISPMLCNIALNGMEQYLRDRFGQAVQFVRFSDDFVVIGQDPDVLRTAIPLLDDFLSVRGLRLSEEKTVITHINDGFDFLGWHTQQHGQQVIATPSARNVNSLLQNIGAALLTPNLNREQMIEMLIAKIKGWIAYHRGIVPAAALHGAQFELAQLVHTITGDKELVTLVGSLFPAE